MPVTKDGRRFMTASDTHVHGSYINDDRRWRQIKKIGQQEAYAKCKDLIPPEIKDQEYLWADKGFIILDFIEMTVRYQRSSGKQGWLDVTKQLQAGMYAVYLATGNYYLFEYMESV